MKETDGSARAARYEANPADEPEFKTTRMRNIGNIPVPVAPVMISFDMFWRIRVLALQIHLWKLYTYPSRTTNLFGRGGSHDCDDLSILSQAAEQDRKHVLIPLSS